MQTRSQTRTLLNDPKNEMFEIPVVRPTEKATTVRPTEKATTVRPTEKVPKVSARVLPDSIINGPSTPINCALYLPNYIQKPLYEVDIDFDSVKAMVEKFEIFQLAESLGGVESLICHPPSMTHAAVPLERRLELGIKDTLIRLSIGIEDVKDLLVDLEQAFASLPSKVESLAN